MTRKKQMEVLKYILERTWRAKKQKEQLEARLKQLPDGSAKERVRKQQMEIEKDLELTLDIIDCLPIHSIEREICEMRHVDLKPWGAVSAEIPMSRSQVYKRHRNALKILLSNQRIQNMTAEYEGEYDAYIQDRGPKN